MMQKRAVVVLGVILLLTGTLHANVYVNPADINNDHRVDIEDFSAFAAAYLTSPPDPNYNPACDIADPADGDVNELDAAVLAANWLWSGYAEIPGGEFQMGDHFNEGYSEERPVHLVHVDSFYMSRHEITNQQYCDYLNSASPEQIKVVSGVVYAATDTGNNYPYCDTHSAGVESQIDFSDPNFIVRDKDGRDMSNDPMIMVSWYGAAAYCDYYGYRLPTEAEWEYAARGGNHSPYYRYVWGDSIDGSKANYWSSGDAYETGAYPWTTPVGYYDGSQTPTGSNMANGYGLYDMTGNVREWCNDLYDSGYYQYCVDNTIVNNPPGPASGTRCVLRGGGWGVMTFTCRVAFRYYDNPVDRDHLNGFRIVMDF